MLETCPKCTCRFAVGLLRCPQCHEVAPMFADRMKEDTMPRITVAGGPSNPDAQPGETGYIAPEGGEDVSAGTSSSTSAGKHAPSSSETPSSSDHPAPAPSTENPSSPDHPAQPASGSADSTAGSTPGTGSGRSRRQGSSTGSRKGRAATGDSPKE